MTKQVKTPVKIVSKEETILEALIQFYRQDPFYLNILASVSRQKTIISLREMDYTVTNYSNNNKVIYNLRDGTEFNMYLNYKCELRGYSKKCFDPFCRRQRLFLDFETKTPLFLEDSEIEEYKTREDGIVTTIGQLSFFKWAIINEVIDYCFANKDKINREMEKMDNKKKKIIKETKELPGVVKMLVTFSE
jgi:hypothetical protein